MDGKGLLAGIRLAVFCSDLADCIVACVVCKTIGYFATDLIT